MAGMKLKSGSLGFWGLVFYAVSVIFPAGAFAVTGVTAMTYAGTTAPLAFLIGGATLFLAIIAIYIFSSKVSNAGGYYKYVESSVHNKYISKSMGLYQLFWVIGDMIAASIIVGWFLWTGLVTLTGYSLPLVAVLLIAFITPIIYLLVGFFSIKVSQKLALIFGIIQIAFFLLLAIALIVKAPYNGVQYFNIGNSTNGLYGFFLAMVVGAFLAYGGYGSIVSFGEEAKLPKHTLKKAIVTALLIMVAFDTFVVYALEAASGPNLGTALQFFAPGLYLTKAYFGIALTLIAFAIVEIAQLMSPVLFGNSASRTIFALARDGLLPKSLTKVHPKYGSPYMSVFAVFGVVVIGVIATMVPLVALYGESNGLFDSFVIWGTAITIFTLIYHIATNESLPIMMHRLKHMNIVSHVVAPTLGSIIMAVAIYYSLQGLTGPLEAVLVMIPAWILISLGIVYVRRNKVKMEPLLTKAHPTDSIR